MQMYFPEFFMKQLGHLSSCDQQHIYFLMTQVVFSVIRLSTKKERKTQHGFHGLSLDASVFDHITSTKGVSGLKRFLAVFLFHRTPPLYLCPSPLLPSGDSGCLVQLLVGVCLDCQKVFWAHCSKGRFPLKSVLDIFFQSTFLPWLSALYHSKKKINL